jgi:hypothetical protein
MVPQDILAFGQTPLWAHRHLRARDHCGKLGTLLIFEDIKDQSLLSLCDIHIPAHIAQVCTEAHAHASTQCIDVHMQAHKRTGVHTGTHSALGLLPCSFQIACGPQLPSWLKNPWVASCAVQPHVTLLAFLQALWDGAVLR